MKVNITFDTENEPLLNLKKLSDAINQLINYRKGSQSPMQQAVQQERPQPIVQQQATVAQTIQQPIPQSPLANIPPTARELAAKQEEKKEAERQKQRTQGGCRVVPYEDMTDKMAEIFSKQRT